ncbi:MAG: hypothetical protein V7L31_17550 [Nostoc sp.]|uniref:hypothetical protein n=1 Tax=Nostoc sp. TaxID=1180 RepID=UPI002FF2A51B
MNSVRLGNEYWSKIVQLLETLPRSKIPVGVRPATRFRPLWAKLGLNFKQQVKTVSLHG